MKIFDSIQNDNLISLINNGKIGIIPTDTVYGIVASIKFPDSVERLYTTKRPGQKKPGTVIASSAEQLIGMGFNNLEINSGKKYLDMGVSVVIEAPEKLSYLNFSQNSQAVRIIKGGALHNLLIKSGPLITSSANLAGQKTVTSISDARSVFADDLDFYVDGGSLDNSLPSTIIKLNNNNIQILRQGSVKI